MLNVVFHDRERRASSIMFKQPTNLDTNCQQGITKWHYQNLNQELGELFGCHNSEISYVFKTLHGLQQMPKNLSGDNIHSTKPATENASPNKTLNNENFIISRQQSIEIENLLDFINCQLFLQITDNHLNEKLESLQLMQNNQKISNVKQGNAPTK